MIRVGQLRAVQRAAYFKPQGRRRIFILDGADTMRWNDADLFLKILEEPPESATLILLAPTPDSLLPTIRSRCLQFHFAPGSGGPNRRIPESSARTQSPPSENWPRSFPSGSPGVALSLDLEESTRLRSSVLQSARTSVDGGKYGEIFAATAQLAKQEKESFENILELFYSLLTDLLEFPRVRRTVSLESRLAPRTGNLGKKDKFRLGLAGDAEVWTSWKAACAAMLAGNWVWTRSSLLRNASEASGERFISFYPNLQPKRFIAQS